MPGPTRRRDYSRFDHRPLYRGFHSAASPSRSQRASHPASASRTDTPRLASRSSTYSLVRFVSENSHARPRMRAASSLCSNQAAPPPLANQPLS